MRRIPRSYHKHFKCFISSTTTSMKYVMFTTCLMLLLTTVRSERSREINIINRLNEFFCFDHNIFLLDDSVQDQNRHITAGSDVHITPQTVYVFDPKSNLNVTLQKLQKTLTTETGRNTFLIVVAAEFSFKSTHNGTHILDEVIAMQQIKNNVKIGIFFEKTISSMEMVSELFQWSWSNKIVNIFCAFYLNAKDDTASSLFNVYRFDPFEAKFLINLTGSNSLGNYFSPGDKIPNYHHHPFRLFGFYIWKVRDFEADYWRTVIRIFNASMSMINVTDEAYAEGRFKTVKEDAGVFVISVKHSVEHVVLYPFGFSWLQLLVPHAQPYTSIVAYLQNSTWTLLFGYIFLVIASASFLLIVSGYLHTNKGNSIVRCVVDVVNLLINDNSAIRYGQLHRADIFIVVPLTFTGLIMANGILSVFKSYLTVPIYQRQIKTIDDLYKSHVTIVAKGNWNGTAGMLKRLNEQNWDERVHLADRDQFQGGMEQLNYSVAYSVLSVSTPVYLNVQKRLNLKAFYLITDQTLSQYFLTLPVNPDYPFLEQLNVIHQRLICHGMVEKWMSDSDEKEVSQLTKAKRTSLQFKSNDSDSDDFGGVITIIWCGWIAGGTIFICELVWNKIQPQINKLKWAS